MVFRLRFSFPPIARMSFAPLPHAPQGLLAAEVIAIVLFAGPPPLACPLARLLAAGGRTEFLPPDIAVIGKKECAAATALPPSGLAGHATQISEEKPRIEPRKRGTKKREIRRRKKSFQHEVRKKIQPEEDGISNRRFSSTFIPPLTEGRESWGQAFAPKPGEFAIDEKFSRLGNRTRDGL